MYFMYFLTVDSQTSALTNALFLIYSLYFERAYVTCAKRRHMRHFLMPFLVLLVWRWGAEGVAVGGTVGFRWSLRHSYQLLSLHMPFLPLPHPTGLVGSGEVCEEMCILFVTM